MLIRSQKKTLLVNMDNVASICANNGNIITDYVNGDHDSIAKYSTEEKAIRVLDMIETAYRKSTGLEHEFTANNLFCVPRAVAFQMPQDSEV